VNGYEYTQMSCDAWQAHHLANRWEDGYGWQVVSVVNLPPGHEVHRGIGDESSLLVPAVTPVTVLFRRPLRAEGDEVEL
jgi:hypothetical protein